MPNQYTYTDPVARFWSRVDQSGGPTACWPRAGAHQRFGYPRFIHQGRCWLGHRFAYIVTFGAPPADKPWVLHKCPGGGNAWCVNPAHLAPGTAAENTADARTAGRLRTAIIPPERRARLMGERNGLNKLTRMQIAQIHDGLAAGTMQHVLAQQHGVSQPTISAIKHGKHWSARS